MDFSVDYTDEIALIDITITRADIRYAEKFKNFVEDIIKNGFKKIVLDCSRIQFMDSTFLGALVVNLKRAAVAGGDLRIVACNCKDTMAWTLFETTRMHKVFQIFDSLEEAKNSYLK